MSEEYKMSEPLTNHNTVFVKNIEQENKDAQYREEFKKEFGYDSSNDFCFYLAGRKAGQEEKEEWVKDYCRVCGKNDELKKEIEILRKANYEVESGNHDTALVDIKKLRNLLERAKPYMLAYCRLVDCNLDDVHELIEEAELILK